MLQYLVILLDDTSVSYCHCDNPYTEHRLIGIEDLRAGILFAMKQNLMIQFVYPDYELPKEYLDLIDTIDHHDIVPYPQTGDVVVLNEASSLNEIDAFSDNVYVLRTKKDDLFGSKDVIAKALPLVKRLNVVLTDVDSMTDDDMSTYSSVLDEWAGVLKTSYLNGGSPQFNLLTDRMMLNQSNHCNAGVENITLAPNGKYYLCPAFYYCNPGENINPLEIPNQQLLRLDYAPLCRHCDAFHCRRCIWLNRKTTLEYNTPSHEQCIVAHTERNAARRLLYSIREKAVFMPEIEIKNISYIDPFVVRKEW